MENKLQSEAKQQANMHSCKLLLNTYIRELAYKKQDDIQINALTKTFRVSFLVSDVIVTGRLSYYSAIGEHEYDTIQNLSGQMVYVQDLVHWITRELSAEGSEGVILQGQKREEGEGVQDELIRDFAEKVDNSLANLTLFIEKAAAFKMHDYCTSEQSLIYGHPFHPFPKNSRGFTDQDVLRYSPELRNAFPLCYIAVRKDVFREEWVDDHHQIEWHESVRQQLAQVVESSSEQYGVLPVHPWQYKHILGIAEVQSYIRERKIVLLGSFGPLAYPTSSVRTVYVPDMNCNIKLSLHMQITNMIRTNSEEQMRRTLDASRYLVQHDCFQQDEHTHIAYETGVTTCHFEDEGLTSLFTVAYRPIEFDPSCTFVVSSLVEAPLPGMPSRLMCMLGGGRAEAEQWLSRYLRLSLLPLVRAGGERGIHFEAHLQNTLVTLQEGWPVAFIVRDLEGVSVDIERVNSAERDRSKLLFYPREKAWARTSYYFMINHLGSLIHALARDVGVQEEHFWEMVREVLEEELKRTGNAYVQHLIEADAFMAKQNLVSCLRGISQTPDYVPVQNVMNRVLNRIGVKK
ncbi:IucA/IucC family protein [Paenibacillus xylanexedens]|uniref:IucA/IucC family protein n=1 Tax=Paenibacillus xylanexedens TaxID=528191 RepID=UPI0021B4CE4C|nr:IucA/IucC family protein [Paenibacillus xylanexedens]